MRATSIIYKRELGRYLRSPVGWIIAAAALLVEGILFESQAMNGEQLSAQVLERYFYWASGIPLFCGVLLAFRLLAEERQNNSMVLLKTSPIRDSEIVLGKFFAALTFLVIIFALSIYMPLLVKVNGKVTWAQIFVGYFGMFLLGSACLAIGLFASALTKHQIVAALLGLLFVLILCMLFPLAKRLDSPVQDVLEQIDLWWIHFQNGFMRGVINLKDIIYYVAVTYFFLLLATKTLEAKRWQ
jgi:ABC-2 type transport system permease protein